MACRRVKKPGEKKEGGKTDCNLKLWKGDLRLTPIRGLKRGGGVVRKSSKTKEKREPTSELQVYQKKKRVERTEPFFARGWEKKSGGEKKIRGERTETDQSEKKYFYQDVPDRGTMASKGDRERTQKKRNK